GAQARGTPLPGPDLRADAAGRTRSARCWTGRLLPGQRPGCQQRSRTGTHYNGNSSGGPGFVTTILTGRQKALVMMAAMLGLFTAAMDQTVVNTAIPRVIADLGGLDIFSWVFSAYMLTSTLTIPVVGKLSDIFGRRLFFIA